MSNFMQYMISLLVIAAIAVIDKFLIIESVTVAAPANMVWIDGSDFSVNTKPVFTDRDTSQDFQSAGFWIDSDTVSKTEYTHFIETSGYAGTTPVQPAWLQPETSAVATHRAPIYALRDPAVKPGDERALQYVSSKDALAYCHWKGLEISNGEQELAATRQKPGAITSDVITLHASQPLSDLSGFRCVKLPD